MGLSMIIVDYRGTFMNRLVVMMPLFMMSMGAMRDVHVGADADVSMPAPFSPISMPSIQLVSHTPCGPRVSQPVCPATVPGPENCTDA